MKTAHAIRHFGGDKKKLADALKVRVQSIYSWGDLVPYPRQLQLEHLTGGKLRAMSAEQYIAARNRAA